MTLLQASEYALAELKTYHRAIDHACYGHGHCPMATTIRHLELAIGEEKMFTAEPSPEATYGGGIIVEDFPPAAKVADDSPNLEDFPGPKGPTPQGSDTPESDAANAAIQSHQTYWDSKYQHLLNFARTLERSRNAAILSANEAHLVVTERRKECNALSARVEKLEALLAEARSTIDTWITSDKRSAELISLQAKVTELGADRADHHDFMSFMAQSLGEWPCCHEKGEHQGTPPMMWPELIGCIVKRATQDAVEQLRKDKEALHSALIEERAMSIYNGLKHQQGWVPWVVGGNSTKQDECRSIARAAIATEGDA